MHIRTAALLAALLPIAGAATAQEPVEPSLRPWTTRCVSDARTTPVACTAERTVLVRQQEDNQILLTLRIQSPAAGAPLTLAVQTPLGLLLPAGLTLQSDNEPVLALPLQTCDNAGCYAATPLTEGLEKTLGSGQGLRVGLRTATGEAIAIDAPLAGFAEAIERIK